MDRLAQRGQEEELLKAEVFRKSSSCPRCANQFKHVREGGGEGGGEGGSGRGGNLPRCELSAGFFARGQWILLMVSLSIEGVGRAVHIHPITARSPQYEGELKLYSSHVSGS